MLIDFLVQILTLFVNFFIALLNLILDFARSIAGMV